jgi:hypothetical protein
MRAFSVSAQRPLRRWLMLVFIWLDTARTPSGKKIPLTAQGVNSEVLSPGNAHSRSPGFITGHNGRRTFESSSRAGSAEMNFLLTVDGIGRLDTNPCLLEWKTSSCCYVEEPGGLLALDPQMVCYSSITGISEVAQVVFVRKRVVEVKYLRTNISEEQRQEFGLLVEDTISQIQSARFLPHSSVRFPPESVQQVPLHRPLSRTARHRRCRSDTASRSRTDEMREKQTSTRSTACLRSCYGVIAISDSDRSLGTCRFSPHPSFFSPVASIRKPHERPNIASAVSTMALPMLSEAVAAGDGTLSTCRTRAEGTNWKSSTRAPSGLSAWARTPEPPGTRSLSCTFGTRRCRA